MEFEPKKWFHTAINHINENQLCERDMMLYLEQYKYEPMIKLHAEPIPFAINIKAKNKLEEKNIQKLFKP